MKRVNKILLISLSIVFIALSNLSAQTNSFYVYVKQNGKKINMKNNVAELIKQPFEIYVEYTAKVDLTVHSSFSAKTYNEALKGNLLFDLIDTESQKSRISIFNKKEILNPNEEKTLIWDKNKTDCDSITRIGERFVSVKKVKKIVFSTQYFDEKTKKTNDFKMSSPVQFVEKDLFFVFLYSEKDKSGDNVEVQRDILKIKWVETYEEETEKFQKKKSKNDKLKVKEAERKLKNKQKFEEKEKKSLEKLDKNKKKREEKEKEKEEKKKKKEEKKNIEN